MGRMNKFLTVLCLLFFLGISGCTKKEVELPEPDKEVIKDIQDLSTIKAYFHNVVKCEKPAGEGILNWGKSDRKYWFEYTGTVEYSIDMSKVDLNRKDNVFHITIPSAKVGHPNIEENTINKDSVITNKDNWWNTNKITSKDVTDAIADAQKEMELEAWQNKDLMKSAQQRAYELIKGYIESLGAASGVEYECVPEYDENIIPEDIQKTIDKLKG